MSEIARFRQSTPLSHMARSLSIMGQPPESERHLYQRYGGTMADLQEAFEEALREERLKAFHIAYKAGFRAAEFRDNENRAMKGKVQPATDAEITRSGEKALRSDAA
jgi:hypothetical protein